MAGCRGPYRRHSGDVTCSPAASASIVSARRRVSSSVSSLLIGRFTMVAPSWSTLRRRLSNFASSRSRLSRWTAKDLVNRSSRRSQHEAERARAGLLGDLRRYATASAEGAGLRCHIASPEQAEQAEQQSRGKPHG